MIFSGKEIELMYKYVQEHGTNKEYTVGKEIPYKNGGIGYKRYISTTGEPKTDIADFNRF